MNNQPNPFAQLFSKQQQQSNQPVGMNNNVIHSTSHNQSPYHASTQNYTPIQNLSYNQNPNVSNQYSATINQLQQPSSFTHNPQQIQQPIKPQQKPSSFESYDTSINIQKLSPKQLLCQCIDLATAMLKDIVDTYTFNNGIQCPYEGRKVIDFSYLANYLLDPARLDNVLSQFLTKDEQTIKALVKSWVFQIKHIRNLWAHSENINYRLAFRGFDTLSLLYDSFGGHHDSALYQKIETYRKALLIAQAKTGVY